MKKLYIPMIAVMATTALITISHAENKSMKLDEFSKVKIYAPVDLDVTVGKKQSFSMEGRDEDLAKIIVEVKGDTLIIKKEKRSGRIKDIKVTVALKNLTKFAIYGSSDAKIRNVDSKSFELGINGSGDVVFDGRSDKLEVEINGSGDVVSKSFDSKQASAQINGSGDIGLAGECEDLSVSINGSGDFSGRNLTCTKVEARISGSGDATVYASGSVQVRTSGSSDVDVYGNPESVQNRSSGSSDFIVHKDK